MAFTLVGLVLLAFARFLSSDPDRGGADRRRQRGVPSRGVARRPGGVGRPARLRPEPVPGWRQFRPVDRAAARGLHRRAVRAALGAGLHRFALAAVVILTGVSRWYAAVRARPRKAATRPARDPGHPRKVVVRTLRADRDAVLEGALPRQHRQLLHLLPDPDFRRFDSDARS